MKLASQFFSSPLPPPAEVCVVTAGGVSTVAAEELVVQEDAIPDAVVDDMDVVNPAVEYTRTTVASDQVPSELNQNGHIGAGDGTDNIDTVNVVLEDSEREDHLAGRIELVAAAPMEVDVVQEEREELKEPLEPLDTGTVAVASTAEVVSEVTTDDTMEVFSVVEAMIGQVDAVTDRMMHQNEPMFNLNSDL